VHIGFADLVQLDQDSVLQDRWIGGYRARWAAHRAAASVGTGDGVAWLEGDAARAVACDAMIIPVVMGDIAPGAVEQLIGLCVQYERIRGHARDGADAGVSAGSPDSADAGQAGGPTGPGAGTTGQAGQAWPGQDATGQAEHRVGEAGPGAGPAAQVLAMLEHQILATVIQIVSGPGASPRSSVGTCSASPWAGQACRWTSGSPSPHFVS
jgi:hypothetical protein